MIIFIITLTISCKSDFTYSIRSEMQEHKVPLTKIQFYNSTEIELKRTLRQDEKTVSNDGEYKTIKGKRIEFIIVPSKTPGVFVKETKDTIFVSFDPDDINKILPFRLLNGLYFLDISDKGEVTYNSLSYEVSDGMKPYL